MSKLKRSLVIFCAEYLVLAEGVLFFLCILLAGNLIDQVRVLLTGSMILVVALTIAKLLKKIVHKRRPLKKTEIFKPFDRYAFPSAHSASLFALTMYILSQNFSVGIVALIVTILIVVARVESRVHDYVDIAGGFIIGVGVTYYLADYITVFATSYLVPVLL